MLQGVTLLLIGTGLELFSTMLPTVKRAVFGTSAQIDTVGHKFIVPFWWERLIHCSHDVA
ncbi:hypothetical protein [Coxiella-like endosymbiont]|uniref:hypothetical protein n=1 Tax=Coxiella-like endosymbiont TaxID=1592897 RepID=UPI00272A25D4|nr:hypothetical protein [Coxiella-like endosymbiont]